MVRVGTCSEKYGQSDCLNLVFGFRSSPELWAGENEGTYSPNEFTAIGIGIVNH